MKSMTRLRPVAILGTGTVLCATLNLSVLNFGDLGLVGSRVHAQEKPQQEKQNKEAFAEIIKQLKGLESLPDRDQAQLILKLRDEATLKALTERFMAKVDQKQVDAWIAALSSEDYYERDEAAMSLFKIRALIRDQLVKAMNEEITIEAKELIQAILDRQEELSDLTEEDELVLNFLDALMQSPSEPSAVQLNIFAEKHLHPVIRQRASINLYKISSVMMTQLLQDYLVAISENSSEKLTALDQTIERMIKRQSRVKNFQWNIKVDTHDYLKQMREMQMKVMKEGNLDVLKPEEADRLILFYAFLIEDAEQLKTFKTEQEELGKKIASFTRKDEGLDEGELAQRIEYLQKFLHLHASNETQPLTLPRDRHLVLLKRLSNLYTKRQGMQGQQKDTVKWQLDKLRLTLRMESVDQETMGYENLLVELSDPEKELPTGFAVKNGALMLPRGSFRTLELSARPKGAFELRLRVTRTEGRDALYIGFPISETGRHAGLNISGWGGEWSGVDMIRNMEASNNPSTAKAEIKQNQTYELQIVVTYPQPGEMSVLVLKDGKEYITWTGQEADVNGNTIWRSSDRSRILIGSHATVYRVDQLLFREIASKEAKLKNKK